MRRVDASNQPDDNYECSKQRREILHVTLNRDRSPRTIRPAMASSIVSISIRAILRSFSKNLNRLIVPYWEKIVRIPSSLVSVLNKRLSRFSPEDQWRRLTEYSTDAKHCPVEKYCYSFSIRAFWIDAVENWWSLWLNPYPRREWPSVWISMSFLRLLTDVPSLGIWTNWCLENDTRMGLPNMVIWSRFWWARQTQSISLSPWWRAVLSIYQRLLVVVWRIESGRSLSYWRESSPDGRHRTHLRKETMCRRKEREDEHTEQREQGLGSGHLIGRKRKKQKMSSDDSLLLIIQTYILIEIRDENHWPVLNGHQMRIALLLSLEMSRRHAMHRCRSWRRKRMMWGTVRMTVGTTSTSHGIVRCRWRLKRTHQMIAPC